MKYIRFISVFLVVFAAWCAPANAAYVLTNEGTPTGTGSVTLTSSSFNPGAGGLVYVVVWDNSGAPGPPTDGTNTYTVAQTGIFGHAYNTYYYYYASSPGTITVSYVTSVNFAGMSVTLISGTNGTYDASGSASASGAYPTLPSVTSSAAAVSGELAIGSVGSAYSFTYSNIGGWSSPPNSFAGGATYSAMGQQTVSGTGAVTYTPQINSGTISSWGAYVDLFEPAAAVATVHTLTLLGVGQ